jgi:hypothetical protein
VTVDKEKLKALAESLIVANDQLNECGKGNEFDDAWSVANDHYVEATDPEVILGLLAEIERLERFEDWFVRLDQVEQSLAASYKAERDQLKAENEALRKDAQRYRWLRDKQTFIWLIQDWFPGEAMLTNVDADIDASMAKEVSHG